MTTEINPSTLGKWERFKNFVVTEFKAIFFENNKLSLGRIMLIIMFITLYVMWIYIFVTGIGTTPESMINVFYSLLGYCFGTKFAGVARKVVDKVKDEAKTANVENPDA